MLFVYLFFSAQYIKVSHRPTNMNENELLLRAKEERDEIFERYDKGREGNSLINSWEETKFEVYHRADR